MRFQITFDVLYEAGHTYVETWEKTEYFCPHCGNKSVWDEVANGDYYLGTTLTCENCGGTFHHPLCDDTQKNSQLRQRMSQFRRSLLVENEAEITEL